jgi:hypothetical protein
MEDEAGTNKKSDNQQSISPPSKVPVPIGPLTTDGNEINNNASKQTKKYPFSELVKLPWKDRAELILLSIEIVVIVIGTSYFYGEWKELANQTIVLSSQVISGISDSISADARTRQQIKLLQDQIDTIKAQMRQDQRPWIHVTWSGQFSVAIDSPITTRVGISNSGKSPAERVMGLFRIDLVKNGKSIRFLEIPVPKATELEKIMKAMPVSYNTIGIVFANDPPSGSDVARTRKTGKFSIEPRPLSAREYEQLKAGTYFIAVHGIVTYIDVFGVEHWTKFCSFGDPVGGPHSFFASDCAEYNSVDGNN